MHEAMTFNPTQILGVIDLRSLGYYKIKQGDLQQNLKYMYHFESTHEVLTNSIGQLTHLEKRKA